RALWTLSLLLVSVIALFYVLASTRTPITKANFERIKHYMLRAEVEEILGVPNGQLPEPTWWRWARFVMRHPQPGEWGHGAGMGELIYDGPEQFAPVFHEAKWQSMSCRVTILFDDNNRVRAAICAVP